MEAGRLPEGLEGAGSSEESRGNGFIRASGVGGAWDKFWVARESVGVTFGGAREFLSPFYT